MFQRIVSVFASSEGNPDDPQALLLALRSRLNEERNESDPIVGLGANAETLLEATIALATAVGRLLNITGYGGPLEGVINAQLDVIEKLSLEQVKLTKKEMQLNSLSNGILERLHQRLEMEENEVKRLAESRVQLEASFTKTLNIIEKNSLEERQQSLEYFEILKRLRQDNELLIKDQTEARLRASNLQDQINELEEALEELTGRYLQLQNEAKAPGTALQRVIIDPLVAEGKSNCSTSEEKYKFDILGSVLEYETETETETSLMNKQT